MGAKGDRRIGAFMVPRISGGWGNKTGMSVNGCGGKFIQFGYRIHHLARGKFEIESATWLGGQSYWRLCRLNTVVELSRGCIA